MNFIDLALEETFDHWYSSFFSWGSEDCCLSPADYVFRLTGLDPASAWRNQYNDKAGAYRFINAAGGLSKLVDTGMKSIGGDVATDLRRGDIVVAGCSDFDVVGIFKNPYVAFRSETTGVCLSKRLRIKGVWRA